jgi:hypothetical protein
VFSGSVYVSLSAHFLAVSWRETTEVVVDLNMSWAREWNGVLSEAVNKQHRCLGEWEEEEGKKLRTAEGWRGGKKVLSKGTIRADVIKICRQIESLQKLSFSLGSFLNR